MTDVTDDPPQAVPLPGASAGYRWVYIWHWPIRAMHWAAAASLLVLIATGFYIGRPYFMTSGEASAHFLMGWVRFSHFAAAGVLVATGIVRVYWLFRGNRYERWRALFPVTKKDWVNMGRIAKRYLLIHQKHDPQYLGHNPLQQLSYTLFYVVVLVQVVTGFGLYGLSNPTGFFYRTFGWSSFYLGGEPVVRFIHHTLTWLIITYIPVHIYFALRAEVTDREAIVSSIFSGGRWVRDDVEYEDA